MNKKRASAPLHITFHNPNTQEETVRELVHIAAQMAKTRVEAHLLSLEQPEQEEMPQQEQAFEMCIV